VIRRLGRRNAVVASRTAGAEKREKARNEYFKDEDAWTGANEKGWFRAPRTLPLLLSLMRSKELSGRLDPTQVYLELLTRHIDSGVVEMAHEADHAYAAGYMGARAVRTWQERMKLLERLGFIKMKHIGQRCRWLLIAHPVVVVEKLRSKKLAPTGWWDAYRSRQMETKEESFEERSARLKAEKAAKASA
jgi:hypothetical protein